MTPPIAVGPWLGDLSPGRRRGLAALCGAFAALGLAPFDLWPLGWAGFAGMVLLVGLSATPARAFLTAWIAGSAYFAVALHWIVAPFMVDPARDGWMAPFALILMAGGMALFWGASGWVAARLVPSACMGLRMAGFAGLLVLAEVARAHALTGFPWAHPGHILIGSPLLALAPVVGPHGLTALVLGLAAAVAWGLVARPGLAAACAAMPVLGAIAALALVPAAPAPAADAPVVRLIQPNAPQHLKWREDMIEVFFQRGLDLTAAAPVSGGAGPDLVVWPETVLPVLLERSDAARARIAQASGPAQVLLGAQRFEGFRARNTSALLSAQGQILQVYDKHHLVPFGEYIPGGRVAEALGLRGLAEVLADGYTPGAGPDVIEIGGGLGRAFPMICYEAIFPGYIRQVPRPDWMVHLTNDAWFGDFSGPYQHLAIARLRAAEQGLPVLRAANTGVSAVIDARGGVSAALPLNEAGFLDAALPAALPPTLYARTGDLPSLLLIFLGTGAVLVAARRKRPLRPGR